MCEIINLNAAILAVCCKQIGNGLLRIMYGRSQSTADIIPVDLAVNLVIAAAWHTAVER